MLGLQRIVAFGLVGLGLGLRVDAAATTNATCTTALWTFNLEHQSPCFVAASLLGACNGGTWMVEAIPTSGTYAGPVTLADSSPCQCSTVVYSLISACAACQNALVGSWSNWSFNCSLVDLNFQTFPLTIPPGVGVPAWAYQDVLLTNIWDANAAQSNNGPESSASSSPAFTQTADTTNTFPSATDPFGPTPAFTQTADTTTNFPSATDPFGPAPTTSNSSSKSSSNIGPIVGGAVGGGVGGLALIGLVGFFVYRQKTRPQSRESQNLMAANPSPFVTTPTTAGFSPIGTATPMGTGTSIGATHYEIPQTMKLYNPDDPSTFPEAEDNTVPTVPISPVERLPQV